MVWLRRTLRYSNGEISYLLRTIKAGLPLEVQLVRIQKEVDVTIQLLRRGVVTERTYLAEAVISLERVQPALRRLLARLETSIDCNQQPPCGCGKDAIRLATDIDMNCEVLRNMRCQLIADMYPELKWCAQSKTVKKRISARRLLARNWSAGVDRCKKFINGCNDKASGKKTVQKHVQIQSLGQDRPGVPKSHGWGWTAELHWRFN